MTLAQEIGWSALTGWCTWMISALAVANALNEAMVRAVQTGTGSKGTGDSGIHPR